MNFRTKKTHQEGYPARRPHSQALIDSAFTINAAYQSAMSTIAAHELTLLHACRLPVVSSTRRINPPAPTDETERCLQTSCRESIVFQVMTDNDVPRKSSSRSILQQIGAAFSLRRRHPVDNFLKRRPTSPVEAPDNIQRLAAMTDDDGKTVIGFYAIKYDHSLHHAFWRASPQTTARRPAEIHETFCAFSLDDWSRQKAAAGTGDLLVDCLKRDRWIAELESERP